MSLRTDLAMEKRSRLAENDKLSGISQKSYSSCGLDVFSISVETRSAAQKLSKPVGEYVTISSKAFSLESTPSEFSQRSELLSSEIKRLCGSFSSALVVGLGNRSITPDRLGADVADKIFATRHIKRLAKEVDVSGLSDISVISSGVMGQTGLEAAEIVKAVSDKIHPDIIIAVDALACCEADHLGATIQLCDTGISPGSGVENARAELSASTLGRKVIAIGVPTVIDVETITDDTLYKGMFVTPRGIDNLVRRTSQLIAMSLNLTFHPSLSVEEITSLV